MRLAVVNSSDISGGAARAAYRIHHSLRNAGIDSRMLVNVDLSDDWTVKGPTSKWDKAIARMRPQLASPLRSLLHTENPILHSPAIFPSRWPERINASCADVVHLHWVQDEMLSISDIPRILKPIVWTLHDMWAFCGAEHYTIDNRWSHGYIRSNRPSNENGFDLNKFTWRRKLKYWRRPIQIVCPSQWLADCVQNSALMSAWPVAVVPNPIDTDRWQPIEKPLARHLLGLPQSCPLLLFGAIGGGKDPRKGIDLLLSALSQLRSEPILESLQLVVFGQKSPQHRPHLSFPVHYTGHLHDDLTLRALYSAADAMVIPSRQDNLPNTGLEAHACATPVVAFNTGGMSDIVSDRTTGALAQPFDPMSLAAAIRWVLEDSNRHQRLSAAARARAESLWSPGRVAGLYTDIYRQVIETRMAASTKR